MYLSDAISRVPGNMLSEKLRLRSFPVTHEDLSDCVRLLPPWLPIASHLRQQLPIAWTRLLGHPAFSADLVTDIGNPKGKVPVALGMSIVLPEAWALKVQDSPDTAVIEDLYRDILKNRFDLPDDRTLGRWNAEGKIHILILHYAQTLNDMKMPDAVDIVSRGMSAFRKSISGYKLQSVAQFGVPKEELFLLSMGYQKWCNTRTDQVALYGLTRFDAARLLPGTPVRDAFLFAAPVIQFSGSERKVLRLAVHDMDDTSIADQLAITPHTLKKVWRNIHVRAAEKIPELFDEASESGGTRGKEKRRDILHYLREHPEELRPYYDLR